MGMYAYEYADVHADGRRAVRAHTTQRRRTGEMPILVVTTDGQIQDLNVSRDTDVLIASSRRRGGLKLKSEGSSLANQGIKLR